MKRRSLLFASAAPAFSQTVAPPAGTPLPFGEVIQRGGMAILLMRDPEPPGGFSVGVQSGVRGADLARVEVFYEIGSTLSSNGKLLLSQEGTAPVIGPPGFGGSKLFRIPGDLRFIRVTLLRSLQAAVEFR